MSRTVLCAHGRRKTISSRCPVAAAIRFSVLVDGRPMPFSSRAICGVRALRALGITPGVYHMNEGHSSFAVLEVIRSRMRDEGISFDEAVPSVSCEVVFTTHTPVPAGHDRFDANLIEEHLGPLRDDLGISHERLMALGRENPGDYHEGFCMTVVALKLSRRANAVSSLHGGVSRAMWTGLYPGRIADEVPIVLRRISHLGLFTALACVSLTAQIAEPILTKSAIPFEPGSGGLKLDYAGGLGSSGGNSQVIPQTTLEVGVYNRLELLAKFPVLRVTQPADEMEPAYCADLSRSPYPRSQWNAGRCIPPLTCGVSTADR